MEYNSLKYDEFFLEVARPIIEHEKYQQMKLIPHHHGTVFDHCIDVAYYAYRIAQRRELDTISIIRGALLHDFYLYKFKKRENKNILFESIRHSRRHPRIALNNAKIHFEINKKEEDIIKNHMFPVGLPKSQEAWITTFADKTLAIYEYSTRFFYYMRFKSIRVAQITSMLI